jgi:hypothetical protein
MNTTIKSIKEQKLIHEDELYAHWGSATQTIDGLMIIDFREWEEEKTLKEYGFYSEGTDLMKDGKKVGDIKRGCQKLDFNIPYPYIVP